MSGEETLAQVYRELEHPKITNLKKVGFIIFLYSLVFTAGVAFFAVMIIPDATRPQYFGNLIGGLAMNLVGPYEPAADLPGLRGDRRRADAGRGREHRHRRLKRRAEPRLRRRHPSGLVSAAARRFGTSYRMLNLVVGLQIATIILSRGDIFVLGEAYAFGVMWSFAMNSVAVLVLRYKQPGKREFRVPLNLKIGDLEIPLGSVLLPDALALCFINLLTKQVATVSGIAFTLSSSRCSRSPRKSPRGGRREHRARSIQRHFAQRTDAGKRRRAPRQRAGADQQLSRAVSSGGDARPRKVDRRDIVVLHVRLLRRSGSAKSNWTPTSSSAASSNTFSPRRFRWPKNAARRFALAVVSANDLWDGILRAAVNLQSSTIVLGQFDQDHPRRAGARSGLAWESCRTRAAIQPGDFSPRAESSSCSVRTLRT